MIELTEFGERYFQELCMLSREKAFRVRLTIEEVVEVLDRWCVGGPAREYIVRRFTQDGANYVEVVLVDRSTSPPGHAVATGAGGATVAAVAQQALFQAGFDCFPNAPGFDMPDVAEAEYPEENPAV